MDTIKSVFMFLVCSLLVLLNVQIESLEFSSFNLEGT